ncbi:DUF881 domain-containing protein [Nocardioides sp. URHA0032]|uniref:DUF881 domain-containing protein n=1 Tax=Nocardioides sp. URHA0032 TaxID=1380388 RepID=UPI0006867941|nr:DUF881 domain-containing protein [Nocardioides sp. URHA0032]
MPEVPESPQSPASARGPESPTGRERLRGALLRPTRGQVVVAVLLAVLGYAAVTQVRFTQVDNTYAGLREQDLIDVLNGLAGTTQRAESEITRLQRTRDDLQSDTGAREAALAQAQQQADNLAILAGLVPVTGPGIRLTVTEETGQVDVQTMVDTIQELRTAGAEAIQVNGQVRVVADTAVEDAAGGLLIDGQLVSSPYVIDAIGDPHTLADSGIDFPDGPRDLFAEDGASITVDELQSLDIESVVKPSKQEFATPAPAQ